MIFLVDGIYYYEIEEMMYLVYNELIEIWYGGVVYDLKDDGRKMYWYVLKGKMREIVGNELFGW